MPSPGLQDSEHIASQVAAWRRILAEGRQRLAEDFAQGASPGKFLLSHSRLVDSVLRNIWTSSGLPASVAMVAVGGYGRGELFPNSDVDLLLLLGAELADPHRQKLEQLIGLLWDVGLEVGHSVRTLEQCLDETAKDITVQTNLLEARLICGNGTLFRALTAALAMHFDKGEFVRAWGDEGHLDNWCLRYMGCQGPETMTNCPKVLWNSATSWPVHVGSVCIGCANADFWDVPGGFFAHRTGD